MGSGTKAALKKMGFEADYMPKEYTTKALAEGLVKIMKKDEHLLIPRAKRGSKELVRIIQENEIDAMILPIYDVVGFRTENWDYLDDFDIITFASASGAEAFVQELGIENVNSWEERRKKNNVKIGAIGMLTSQALEQFGIRADCIPKQCDIENMIEELRNI